ncbi:hypothetical protein FACS1894137_01450 [Spirochaetia bacterium]|nr:hypothetical protein FACS1894137_01450 [Spirochaetia bacterium]
MHFFFRVFPDFFVDILNPSKENTAFNAKGLKRTVHGSVRRMYADGLRMDMELTIIHVRPHE